MIKLLTSLLLASGLFLSIGDWIKVENIPGQFVIMSPGEMAENLDTIQTEVGNLVYHSSYYRDMSVDADNYLYLVSYVDYPEGTMSMDSMDLIQAFFDTTISAAVSSVDGELRYQDDILLNGFQGKFWRVDYKEGSKIIKTKAYLIGDRFYSIQTFCFKENFMNKASDQFMDSFRLMTDKE